MQPQTSYTAGSNMKSESPPFQPCKCEYCVHDEQAHLLHERAFARTKLNKGYFSGAAQVRLVVLQQPCRNGLHTNVAQCCIGGCAAFCWSQVHNAASHHVVTQGCDLNMSLQHCHAPPKSAYVNVTSVELSMHTSLSLQEYMCSWCCT